MVDEAIVGAVASIIVCVFFWERIGTFQVGRSIDAGGRINKHTKARVQTMCRIAAEVFRSNEFKRRARTRRRAPFVKTLIPKESQGVFPPDDRAISVSRFMIFLHAGVLRR